MFRRVSKYADFSAATTDTTVHTVSPDRKAVIPNIIVNNKETSSIVVTIWDGPSSLGNKKLEVTVAASDTKVISLGNDYGIEFDTSVVAQVSAYTNGSSIWIGGYEE